MFAVGVEFLGRGPSPKKGRTERGEGVLERDDVSCVYTRPFLSPAAASHVNTIRINPAHAYAAVLT